MHKVDLRESILLVLINLPMIFTFINVCTFSARKHGITEVPTDVANLISHATQERLRHVVEKLSVIAEQRTEIYRVCYIYSPLY